MSSNRGDTFIVHDDTHRGNHFTCVGTFDRGFYAGDTNGRMWKFEQRPRNRYQIFRRSNGQWRRNKTVAAETIIDK